MNDCPEGELRDQLPDLLTGRLAPEARRQLETHLAACADCRAELELLRVARRSLHRAPAVDVDRIVAALPSAPRTTRRAWAGWRTAAAITCIAVGGTSLAVATMRHAAPRPASRELAVAGGAIAELSDHELSTLIQHIDSIDVVPSADVETVATIAPVAAGLGATP